MGADKAGTTTHQENDCNLLFTGGFDLEKFGKMADTAHTSVTPHDDDDEDDDWGSDIDISEEAQAERRAQFWGPPPPPPPPTVEKTEEVVSSEEDDDDDLEIVFDAAEAELERAATAYAADAAKRREAAEAAKEMEGV